MARNPARNLARDPGRPRRLRPGRWLLAAALGLPLVLLALALQTAPRAAPAGAPDAAVAREALAASERLRDVASGPDGGRVDFSLAEINAVLASGGRMAPGLAAVAEAAPGAFTLTASLGEPYLPPGIWANLRLGLAADAAGLRIVSARIGRLPLPAGLVEAALVRVSDAALAPGLARAAMAGVVGLEAAGGMVHAELAYPPAERAALLAQLRARLNIGGGGAREPIWAHLFWLDRAGDEGALPRTGSALPFLKHVVAQSAPATRRRSRDVDAALPDREHLRAGLLALALYCGEPALGPAIGVRLQPKHRGRRNHCEQTTLGGRDDLKRHFIVSAALYAASTGDAALGIGEFKELLDSGAGGTGFSFDDMAANLAGARFAAAFLDAPAADWPAMLARIETEADLLPPTADLPRGLTEAEFRARFGDVDAPEYAGMLAEIARRIDALPLHRASPGG